MKRKICVLTATRAEYGLLYPLINLIDKDRELELKLVVSGTHLCEEFGYTKSEIVRDGFEIWKEINYFDGQTDQSISDRMARALGRFSEVLQEETIDLAVILGDRYEMLAFAIALVNARIPIAHLNGGEVSEGALDNIYRNCITQMSHWHFVNCALYGQRVTEMMANGDKVYNVGDICVDNIRGEKLLSREELLEELNISDPGIPLVIVTFHPVTVREDSMEDLEELLKAIEVNEQYFYIFTKANADQGGSQINARLSDYVGDKTNVLLVASLGRKRFLSLLNCAVMMIGNSSSGIYEAPFFGIPTVNVGERQKGRLHGKSVIDCKAVYEDICRAMDYARSEEMGIVLKENEDIWGDGHTADRILDILKSDMKLMSDTADVRGKM